LERQISASGQIGGQPTRFQDGHLMEGKSLGRIIRIQIPVEGLRRKLPLVDERLRSVSSSGSGVAATLGLSWATIGTEVRANNR
jgi:hypothetical protein